MHPEAFKNRSNNEAETYHEKSVNLAPKMEPTWNEKGQKMKWGRSLFASQTTLKIRLRYFVVLGAFWAPSGHLFAILRPFGLPFSAFWQPLASLLASFG